MPPDQRLAPLIAALSLATDLGGGFEPESALRTALLALRLARAHGLDDAAVRDSYWAGALRFLGCTAYAHEESLLMGGDDFAFLQAFADVDLADKPAMLARSVARLAAGRGALQRLRCLLRFLLDPQGGDKVSAAHCQLGEQLSADLGLGAGVSRVLRDMYERWDARGAPRRIAGAALTPATRVLHAAHVIEVYSRMHGVPRALAEVARRSGSHFDPAVAAAVQRQGPALWQGFEAGRMGELFLAEEPLPHEDLEGALPRTARAFAAYADVKSPYMLSHSFEVARVACQAAVSFALPVAEVQQLEVAALLHDLGRVALPNGLWDVPRPFTAAERERARLHSYHGERLLAACPALAPLADWAGAAHERADGQGYHRRVPAAALPLPAQLIAAADTWVALRSPRAHRPAMGEDEARREMHAAIATGQLTERAARAVMGETAGAQAGAAAMPAAMPAAPAGTTSAARSTESRPAGLSARELQVLLRVARGLSNKQIAREFGLSPRTVQTHLEHVFDKTGARTRAAAAIFVVRSGLIELGDGSRGEQTGAAAAT